MTVLPGVAVTRTGLAPTGAAFLAALRAGAFFAVFFFAALRAMFLFLSSKVVVR